MGTGVTSIVFVCDGHWRCVQLGCLLLVLPGVCGESSKATASSQNRSIVRWAEQFLVLRDEEERRHRRPRGEEAGKERSRYMDEKVEVDISVARQFRVPPVLPVWPTSQRQVAFLFMMMDSLDFEDVWDRFFAGATDAYSIYIHRADRKQDGAARFADRFGGWGGLPWGPSSSASVPLRRWGAIDIAGVETRWCALFGAEVALLAAALQDARNQQFVFLSHNTVPLKSHSYIYRQLIFNSPSTSKFCFADPAFHKGATTETIRNELRRQCIFRDFYRAHNPRVIKHHQWVVLSREHSETVVRRAEEAVLLWRESWEAVAPDLLNMGEGCSDESVPITALLFDLADTGRSTGNTWADLTRLGVEQQCLTYVLWRHCFSESELDHSASANSDLSIVLKHGQFRMLTDREFNFFKSAIKRELNGYPATFESVSMDYLWKLVNQGFMFARKFAKGIRVNVGSGLVPLSAALPVLWESVDEEHAATHVWTRLSTDGQPTAI